MPIALPYDLTQPAQREIKAAELMANYQAIVDRFSAGIVAADISPAANIPGTYLALASIPADRHVPASLTQTQMAVNSIGTAQLIDSNVTAAKILAASLAKDRLKVTEVTQAFGPITNVSPLIWPITPAVALPSLSTIIVLPILIESISFTGNSPTALSAHLGYDGSGAVRYVLVGAGLFSTVSGTLRIRYIPAS